MKPFKALIILMLAIVCMAGCAQPIKQVAVDQTLEGFSVPSSAHIKQSGLNRTFTRTSYDEVWDSLIIVMMQEDRIFYASKKTGNLSTSAVSLFVEPLEGRNHAVAVHVSIYTGNAEAYSKEIFGKLATQIYAGKKYKYLYKAKKD